MNRRKTTVYLDADVLTATKVMPAARDRSESQIVEDALRAYLRSGELEAAGADLDDETAMALAADEVRAVRTAPTA